MSIMMVALPGFFAFLSAWWLTNRLCSPTSFLSIHAHPNERTLHSMPTPQTGGLAVIGSVVISLILAASVLAISQPSKAVLPKGVASGSVWIVVSMLLIFVVSFIDDCVGVPVVLRLGVQAVSACIIIGGVGLTLSSVPIPGGPSILLGMAAIPVSVLLLLWMANLYNFMDGMDGFAGGMTFFGFGFLAYFGWQAHFPVMLIIATFVAMGLHGGCGEHNRRILGGHLDDPRSSRWNIRVMGPHHYLLTVHCGCDSDLDPTCAPAKKDLASSPGALLSAVGSERMEPSPDRACGVCSHDSVRRVGHFVSSLDGQRAAHYSWCMGRYVYPARGFGQ
jgi:hypothetical protein